MTRAELIATPVYIVLIVAVNYGFSVVPLVPVWGEMFPPMSLAVGFIFVARDYAQRSIGHYVILAMLLAGGLSYLMADPYVALASVCAFLVSEAVDWAVYSFSKRPFGQRVLLSSAIGTPVDSTIFLAIIGAFSSLGVVLVTVAKMVGAIIVWNLHDLSERRRAT